MQSPCETHFPPPQSQCDHWVYSGPSECSVLFILQRDGSPVSMVPAERQLADADDWAHFRVVCISRRIQSWAVIGNWGDSGRQIRKTHRTTEHSGSCGTYVTELFGVDGSLNHNRRIRHLCEFHSVWMLPVGFLQNTEEKKVFFLDMYNNLKPNWHTRFITKSCLHRYSLGASCQLHTQAWLFEGRSTWFWCPHTQPCTIAVETTRRNFNEATWWLLKKLVHWEKSKASIIEDSTVPRSSFPRLFDSGACRGLRSCQGSGPSPPRHTSFCNLPENKRLKVRMRHIYRDLFERNGQENTQVWTSRKI